MSLKVAEIVEYVPLMLVGWTRVTLSLVFPRGLGVREEIREMDEMWLRSLFAMVEGKPQFRKNRLGLKQ